MRQTFPNQMLNHLNFHMNKVWKDCHYNILNARPMHQNCN